MIKSQLWYYAGVIATGQTAGKYYDSDIPGGRLVVQNRAAGVVFSIAPWNSPLILSARAIVIPLAVGNTVVLKTSEHSPRTQYLLVELFEEVSFNLLNEAVNINDVQAGLPAGVLNLVHMAPQDAPALTAQIIAHNAVKRVTFTGQSPFYVRHKL